MFSSNVVPTLKPLPIFIQNLRSTPLFKNTKNMSFSNHFQNTWILNQVTSFSQKQPWTFRPSVRVILSQSNFNQSQIT
jgi:hypothetical protein